MCDGTLPLHQIFCCDVIAETKSAVTLDRRAHDPPGPLGARLERFMQHDSYAAWNHFDVASSPSGPATMVRAARYEGSVGHVQVFRPGGQGTPILEDHRSLYPDYFRQ